MTQPDTHEPEIIEPVYVRPAGWVECSPNPTPTRWVTLDEAREMWPAHPDGGV